jgi:hypothetical protein
MHEHPLAAVDDPRGAFTSLRSSADGSPGQAAQQGEQAQQILRTISSFSIEKRQFSICVALGGQQHNRWLSSQGQRPS